MIGQTRQLDAYREQLTRLTRALTTTEEASVPADRALREQMKAFTEENFDKRQEKLQAQLAFVAEAFDELDDLLRGYVREVRSSAYDSVATDADRFMGWLEGRHAPTPEQRDYLACQRARHAVEAAARRDRRAHVRFQELWSVAGRLAAELSDNPGLVVHLNPARAWSRFHTPVLLDEGNPLPADALFFAAGNDVRTAVLEPAGQALVRELADLGPCTLDEWAARGELADREELVALCQDLASMGLVAFS